MSKSRSLSGLYWSTKDELKYLKKIGHHFTVGSGREGDVQPLSRLELLQRYRDIMEQRVNWDKVDPWAILLHVNAEIRRLGKEAIKEGFKGVKNVKT